LAASSAYEQFYRRRIERIGQLDLRLLRQQWGSTPEAHD
jgi:hypothetical protein